MLQLLSLLLEEECKAQHCSYELYSLVFFLDRQMCEIKSIETLFLNYNFINILLKFVCFKATFVAVTVSNCNMSNQMKSTICVTNDIIFLNYKVYFYNLYFISHKFAI